MIKNVLIVGGGISGLSLCIGLGNRGIRVSVVDKDKDWNVYGAGISLTGPTLRAFGQLGLLDRIRREGFCHSGTNLCDGATGEIIRSIKLPPMPGTDVPGGGGIMRPVLQKILCDAVAEGGGEVRLGVTLASYTESVSGVKVRFTDGSEATYDIVVGADGLYSDMRNLLFPDTPGPRFTGQATWRATVPRLPEVDCTNLFLLGDRKFGINPASNEEMYFFIVQSAPGNPRVDPAEHYSRLRTLTEGFGGIARKARELVTPQSTTLYRPMESIFVPRPWYRGRVLLIGDAVHASTPHVASGAGIAVEDAVVLSELIRDLSTPSDLFAAFMQRRYARCRMVVENSARIGELEQSGEAELTAPLFADTMRQLMEPI